MTWRIVWLWCAVGLLWACDDADSSGTPGGSADAGRTADSAPPAEDAAPPAEDAEPDGAPPACDDEARRCMGADVQVCLGGEWRLLSTCGAGTTCRDGVCVEDGCVPDCNRKVCGDDGCGGSCGECGAGEDCEGGRCVADGPACRDGVCQAGEDCRSCEADCGCAGDEICGDDGRCVVACQPSCDERACGDDGCGGSCGACEDDQRCNAGGACVAAPAMCGDGACGDDEDCATCPADCGQCCGDGACDAGGGENCATCPADCGCGPDQRCDPNARRCVADCVPNCAGRTCGNDGCGGSCGDCAGNEVCTAQGRCVADCQPMCDDAVCGDNGCGGSCGVCPPDRRCEGGDCVPVCARQCNGRACGDDGCGGSCGACGQGEMCDANGACVPVCVRQCNGRECGDDGCGGSCGACDQGFACEAGQCVDQRGCDCAPEERCLEGVCRAPEALCSPDNPNGLCRSGQDCFAGSCVDSGDGCSPQNPAGLCAPGEICRNGACRPLDDAALCDDRNQCTRDVYDPVRNRCVHVESDGPCSDGNACTADRCEAGQCVSEPIAGCIEPPTIGPYVTPTNVGNLVLTGTKPAGAAVEVNELEAVPQSPEQNWQVNLNLQPGVNEYRIRSVDRGQHSEVVTVRIVYDITPPTTTVTPDGGIFLSGVTVTVAADEAARIYYTEDGGTPDQWSRSFVGARTFRIFDTTTLRFRARDPAGNWEAAIKTAAFEITGHGNGWTRGTVAPQAVSLAAVTSDGSRIFVVGGTDGDAAQAGARQYLPQTDTWTELPALSVPRTQAAAAVRSGSLFVIGGEHDGLPLNLVERHTIGQQGAWAPLRPMPTTRFGHAAATVGDRIFVFGGKTNGGVVLDTVEVYEVLNNTWNNNVAQMPRSRYAFAAAVINNKIYLVGGEDEDGRPVAEVDVYDPARNAWTQAPDLPTPRSFVAVGRMDNIGHVRGQHQGLVVAGGRLADGRATPVVEEYVLELGEWRARTPLPAALYGAGAAFSDTRREVDSNSREIWLAGGQGPGGISADVWVYEHALDYVRLLSDLPEGRFFHAAVADDDQIYLFGGRDFQETVEGWRFDPETETYTDLPNLPSPQNGLAAVALEGRIYAIGGQNEFGLAVPHVRVLDPAEGRWVNRRPLQVARSVAAVAVVGGEIYVIGGDNNGPSQAVEIYDPATDRWRNGPLLPVGRKGAAAVAADGVIYLFGGLGEGDAHVNPVIRLRNGAWENAGGNLAVAYATATTVHDTRVAIFAGRRGGAPSNLTNRYDLGRGVFEREWLAPTQLLAPLDRSAAAWLHGRMYIFGGNANAEPGPSGVSTVQKVEGLCFNGVLDPGEGQGANIADVGGMCGEITGCAVIPDLQAAAMARCQADGFTCVVRDRAILGYANGGGAGSDCSGENQWRFYCFSNGASNITCNANCTVGEMRTGHSPCGCNNQPRLFGHWCD